MCASWEGVIRALWAQGVVLSHSFVTHAAADGRRWAGLRGRRDGSRVPLLLSSVVREPVFEK